jgi:hypothetical protein
MGIKQTAKITVKLVDEDWRSMAHLVDSYPSVVREKAILILEALPPK